MPWYNIRGAKFKCESALEAAETYAQKIKMLGKYRVIVYHDYRETPQPVAGIFDVENMKPVLVTVTLSECALEDDAAAPGAWWPTA